MQIVWEISDELFNRLADAVVERLGNRILPTSARAVASKWLTHAEASQYLRKTPDALYKLTSDKKIKYSKRGKANIFRQEWLDEYQESGTIETAKEVIRGLALAPRKKHSINQK